MEHLSIDDFIRVEDHLSKKLEEACGEFKKFIVTVICLRFNGQPFSRDQFQRIYVDAREFVKDLFIADCRVLRRFCQKSEPVIRQFCGKAMIKIKVLYDLEWQILVSQLP